MLSPLAYTSYAGQGGEHREKMILALQEKEVDYIKNKDILNEKESKLYFPIYKKQQQELAAVRRSTFHYHKKKREGKLSEAESAEHLKIAQENKIKEAKINQKYLNKYLEFISAQKLLQIKSAQKEFKIQYIDAFRKKKRQSK